MASHPPPPTPFTHPKDFVPINTQGHPANVHHTEKTSSPLKPLAAAENSETRKTFQVFSSLNSQ